MSQRLSSVLPGTHPDNPPENHEALVASVKALGSSLTGLADQRHADRLQALMRRPGWTTRHEAALVSAMVDHLHDQVASLSRAHDRLLGAAEQIGT